MWILLTGPSDEQNPYANKVRDAYHKYMGLAILAANRILHNLDDARDAAMQAFVRVLEHPEKVFDGRSDEHIKNYILMIARNTALNMVKHNHVIPIVPLGEDTKVDNSSTDAKLEAKALARSIIASLSETERRILSLEIIYGESVQEIADDLQKTAWAVRKQRSRAIKRIKDYCYHQNIYTQPQKPSHHTGRRIAVALLAALIAATVTVMSVSAAREWFFKVISQMFPTHTEIQYGPNEESQEDEPFVAYAPSFLPEGYELKDGPRVREQTRLVQIGYKGSGSKTIRYTQSFNGGLSIDTEGSYTEMIELNGRDALYIQKEDTKMLYGHIDNAMFLLYVRDPDLAKDDVLKIADSIIPLEKQN